MNSDLVMQCAEAAYDAGESFHSNPYPPGSDEHLVGLYLDGPIPVR